MRSLTSLPYYIIPFDKAGKCTGPETRADLVERVTSQPVTDLFLFSHGWNNDWTVANRRYEDFIEGFLGLVAKHSLAVPDPFMPALVGVFWPSTTLVFGEDETGPDIAGASTDLEARAVVAEAMPPGLRQRYEELARLTAPTTEETEALLWLMTPVFGDEDQEGVGDATLGAIDLLRAWQDVSPDAQEESIDLDEIGDATTGAASILPTSTASPTGSVTPSIGSGSSMTRATASAGRTR